MPKNPVVESAVAVFAIFALFVAGAFCLERYIDRKDRYIGRKGESRIELQKSYRATRDREGERWEWEVVFRGLSKEYEPLEKKAGFDGKNSYRFYVQDSEEDEIPIDVDDLDAKAREAGKRKFLRYLPEGIYSFVMERNAGNGAVLPQLTDGQKITIVGTVKESHFTNKWLGRSSKGNILTTYDNRKRVNGFVHIAETIEKGWH